MWMDEGAGGYGLMAALWVCRFFIFYFLALNGTYITFIIIGMLHLRRHAHDSAISGYYSLFNSYLVYPVSIIVPAHNEEMTIISTVRSLLLQHFPRYEVIIVDDGSDDRTIELLIKEFELRRLDKIYRQQIKTKKVKALYESRIYPNLIIVSKERGGKGDALNCGINVSSFPYYCAIDADTVLDEDALLKLIRPFLNDPSHMIAVGGIVRVANSCTVETGRIVEIRSPSSLIELVQTVEYLQAFLTSRIAFSRTNSILLISGAFGMFRKQPVIQAGGYNTRTIGEDMELIVRLQRIARKKGLNHTMQFIADPSCWTEVPSDWWSLSRQRVRWQKGLIDSIRLNSEMLFNPRFGRLGMLALPYYLIFELLGPIIEFLGLIAVVLFFLFGLLSWHYVLLFFLLSVGVGMLISVSAVVLQEMSFHRYPRLRHVAILLIGTICYNFGFRQLQALWRLIASLEYLTGLRLWGRIRRRGFKEQSPKESAA